MKNCKVDFKIRESRFLLWLIVLLTIFLIVAIGVYVFLSIDSKYRMSCLFSCEEQEKNVGRVWISPSITTPDFSRVPQRTKNPPVEGIARTVIDKNRSNDSISRSRTQATGTSEAMDSESRPSKKSTPGKIVIPSAIPVNVQKARSQPNRINITGEISFKGKAPKRFRSKSRLIVEFRDVTRQDAPSVLLGKTLVDLSVYRKKKTLRYVINCKRPKLTYGSYSVSAVLNVGWKSTGRKWIRKGDYLTVSRFPVRIEHGKITYQKNIVLAPYKH